MISLQLFLLEVYAYKCSESKKIPFLLVLGSYVCTYMEM